MYLHRYTDKLSHVIFKNVIMTVFGFGVCPNKAICLLNFNMYKERFLCYYQICPSKNVIYCISLHCFTRLPDQGVKVVEWVLDK